MWKSSILVVLTMFSLLTFIGCGDDNQSSGEIIGADFRIQLTVSDHGQNIGPLILFKILDEFLFSIHSKLLPEFLSHKFPIRFAESRYVIKDIAPQVIIISLFRNFSGFIEGDPARAV